MAKVAPSECETSTCQARFYHYQKTPANYPHHLCQIWKSGMSEHQTWTPQCFGRQLQAVLFIFFHSGEITVPSAVAFNPAVHPAYGDVAVDNVQNPSVVHFHLKRSKCDQLGTKLMCSSVTVGLCPVTAVLTYITQCGDSPGAFFLLEGGRPLTKAYFIARIQAALRSAGVQFSDYTGHSCSWYPGFHNSMFRRWSSTAFLSYLQTPWNQLPQFAGTLLGSEWSWRCMVIGFVYVRC